MLEKHIQKMEENDKVLLKVFSQRIDIAMQRTNDFIRASISLIDLSETE
jgi:hypothetical protein